MVLWIVIRRDHSFVFSTLMVLWGLDIALIQVALLYWVVALGTRRFGIQEFILL